MDIHQGLHKTSPLSPCFLRPLSYNPDKEVSGVNLSRTADLVIRHSRWGLSLSQQ